VVAISAAVLPVPRVRSPKNWPKLSRLVGCLTGVHPAVGRQ
jgi:hypothetical protein